MVKKRKMVVIGCLCLAMLIMGGLCLAKTSLEADAVEKEADVIEKGTDFHAYITEYTENEDGTYTCYDEVYQYKIAVTGREPTAVKDSTFVVLTNDKDVSFETVSKSLFSNKMYEHLEFKILGCSY